MKSILQRDRAWCYLCEKVGAIEEHHIFGGINRRNSEKFGLKVYLCHSCHNEPPNGVHFNKERRLMLQENAQRAAMAYYNWSEEEFRVIFGRSY